jgi:hypothetical protein
VSCALATSLLLCGIFIYLGVKGELRSRFTLNILVITQGPSREASLRWSRVAQETVAQLLDNSKLAHTVDMDQQQALLMSGKLSKNWLTTAHFAVTSNDLTQLDPVTLALTQLHKWTVQDLDRSSPFSLVEVRPGITVLRLSRIVGTAGRAPYTRIQFSQPRVYNWPVNTLAILFFLFLIICFGAGRRNREDPFSYPAGLDPAIVYSHFLMLALFAGFLVVGVAIQPPQPNLGLIVVTIAMAAASLHWLWATRGESGPKLIKVVRLSMFSATAILAVMGTSFAIWR